MITTELAGAGPNAWTTNKIQSRHRERSAMVYVRQSTPQQVLENRESAALQYGLRCRAVEWGWGPEQVVIVDQDQGQSGSSAAGRSGFQHLLAEVGLDHVGLILGIEMSRLARSCRDWYQLLELCAIFGVLLGDQDGLYDPQHYNDRLLLGLKGTISEAELHLLRQRSWQGTWNKAKRGALFNHVALGYVYDAGNGLQKDPDEQVQSVVELVLAKFDQIGSVNGLLDYMVRNGVQMPIRSQSKADRGQLRWHRPNRTTLANMLHNPIYAGAYCWGRHSTDPKRKAMGKGVGKRRLAPEDAKVLIKDHCPAYITWQQYQDNVERMQQNRCRWNRRGPVRGGGALLAGLVVCGTCGCKLLVAYAAKGRTRYTCMRNRITYGSPTCQSFAGRGLEELVEQQILRVLEPAGLELCLAAAADNERERTLLDQQWRQKLERAAYDAQRAGRQLHAVEPENRLVGRELEKRWEQALLEEQRRKQEYEQFQNQRSTAISETQRQQIETLAQDIPSLWRSSECTATDRQQIMRHLVERVVVTGRMDRTSLDVAIHFVGGFVSSHELTRPVSRWEQLPEWPQLQVRIRELAGGQHTAQQIADELNREGWHPPKRRGTFNAPIVQGLLARLGLCTKRPPAKLCELLGPDEWWITDLARTLDVSPITLQGWRRRGWIHARQLSGPQGRWIMWADQDELDRLGALRSQNRTWYNQPQSKELTTPKPRPETKE